MSPIYMLILGFDYEGYEFPSFHSSLESAIEESGVPPERWTVTPEGTKSSEIAWYYPSGRSYEIHLVQVEGEGQ